MFLFNGGRRAGRGVGIWLLWWGAVLCLGYGFGGLLFARDGLMSMPVTPLSELPQYAGTNRLVRVQARIISDPAAIGPEGETLALQRVQVASGLSGASKAQGEEAVIEEAAAENHVEIHYDETVPGVLWASDGQDAVAVDPMDFDLRLAPETVRAKIGEADALPLDISVALLADFNDVPLQEDATVRLWNMEQGQAVTIIGIVSLDNGQPVLHAPADERSFIISPLPAEEFGKRAVELGLSSRLSIWGFIVVGVLLATAAVVCTNKSSTRRPRGSRARRLSSANGSSANGSRE